MNCQQTQTHTVKPGDSLYLIAQMHQMAVSELMELNPGVDPYNLQIGTPIVICHGMEIPPGNTPSLNDVMALNNAMRLAWEQHVYWTRMLMVSIVSDLKDLDAVQMRLMRNPADIAAIFAQYYPADTAAEIARLLTEHLQIGGDLITAWSRGEMPKANALNVSWYRNADQMAKAFASINPNYDATAIRNMLYRHLDLTKQEIANRLAGDYPADIAAFDLVEQEAMNMADYFSMGIMQQFPMKF